MSRRFPLNRALIAAALSYLVLSVPGHADHGGSLHLNAGLNVPASSTTGNYTVTWNSGYQDDLQEKVGSGSYTNVYSGTAGTKSFTGKSDGTYTYRIRRELCFFTCHYEYSAPQSIIVSSPQPPGVPGNISGPDVATDFGSGASYTLSWTAASGIVQNYQLQRDSGGGFSTIQTSSALSRSESGIAAGSYDYRVRACNADGCSGYTPVKSVLVGADVITTPPGLGSADSVGTVPYGLDVGTDGDAMLTVPLQLIPGVAGFAPSLWLEYDSGRGIDRLEQSLPEDTLGYGWRLAGLSQIRRCVVNQSSGASINLSSGDSLCLDGMPLVRTGGTHFAVGATYRTLIESYVKIETKGSAGALWFEVTLPDGTVREYGRTAGSRVDRNGGTDYQWSISKATSADGNVIDYTWHHNAANGINYITSIDYDNADIDFQYRARTDASPVSIGSAPQTQSVFLHTVRVRFLNKTVREYRLVDEVVSNRRRLNRIQLCGFDEANGTTMSCLTALDLDWMTPTSTMAGVEILVSGLTDGLGAAHQIQYGTITGSSHTFLFTERPYGNGALPSNTQLLPGPGARRHVATRLRRDNGLGGFHDTSYAYQNVGVESTRHWGFLGFYAQRITDDVSGVVTYVQYRLDYPYFGEIARLRQYDAAYGSHTQTLTRSENDYAQQTISHGGTSSVYPYVSSRIDFVYEGATQLGAAHTSNTLTFVSGFVDRIDRTLKIGTSVASGSPGSIWGDIPTYTVSSLLHTTESDVEFNNRTTGGNWLIGFADAVSRESWAGTASGNGIVQDATMTPHATSLKVDAMTAYPNHARLTLLTDYTYDSRGRLTDIDISGDNVAARNTTVNAFVHDRYPDRITNDKGHDTTLSDYDVRFGIVEVRGDPNARNTTTRRDAFGRVTSATNPDNVVTTTTYNDCSSGCAFTVYGIAPAYYVQSDSSVTPIRRTYFDELGRVIRSETEMLTGSFSKEDTKYDTQGRVEKVSMPYFSGATKDVVLSYDIRNRVTNVARPDGSSTAIAYTASGSTAIETITENVRKANGTSDGTQVKRNEYNVLSQLVKTTDGYGSGTDPSTTYTYDANGNLKQAVVNGGSGGSTTTTYEYDEAGNQTKVIDPNSGTMTSTYSALWEVKTQTDAKAQVRTYGYDTLGRLTSLVTVDGTSTWTWDTALRGKGRLASRTNGSGFTETYNYNLSSKLSSVVTTITPIGGGTATAYTTSFTYDSSGRPATTTYPGAGFVLTYEYNARGYLSKLKDGSTAIQTFTNMDAFGNSTGESYGNGVTTTRVYDPETGRLTDIDTSKGGTILQNNEYGWRSNGTLESRLARPVSGIATTREERYVYDVLNRVDLAETFINSSNTRDLDYAYDELGNLTSKTSTLSGDTDVTAYAYGAGAAGPHAVTSATIDGTGHTLTYDANGAVTKYDIAGTADDKYLAYNAFNQPTTITHGNSLTDTTPVAKDQFAYDPNGRRYYRKSTGTFSRKEDVVYVGDVEIVTVLSSPNFVERIYKTRLSDNVMHVRVDGVEPLPPPDLGTQPRTETFFEYAHRDHLGSIEAVTDDSGAVLDQMGYEPFGMRKAKNWSSNAPAAEVNALLAADWDHTPKVRGFTGHEHLDSTGFIHMNGRVYDPVLGRFLSPDPLVPRPVLTQSWNRYSYVRNTPASLIDPTGFFDEGIRVGIVVSYQNQFLSFTLPFSRWRSVEQEVNSIDPATLENNEVVADDAIVDPSLMVHPQTICHMGCHGVEYTGRRYTNEQENFYIQMALVAVDVAMPLPPLISIMRHSKRVPDLTPGTLGPRSVGAAEDSSGIVLSRAQRRVLGDKLARVADQTPRELLEGKGGLGRLQRVPGGADVDSTLADLASRAKTDPVARRTLKELKKQVPDLDL